MQEPSQTAAFRLLDDVRYRIIAPEAVVVRQGEGEVLVLNEVAARVLELVDQGSPVGRMVEVLLEEYEVERESLAADVAEILERHPVRRRAVVN